MLCLAPQTHLPVLKASLLSPDSQLHRTFPSHSREPRLCWPLAKFWVSPGRWASVLGAPEAHLLEEIRLLQALRSHCWLGSGLFSASLQEVQEGPDGWGCQPRSGQVLSGHLLQLLQLQARKVGPRNRDAVQRRPCSRGWICCLPVLKRCQ